MRGLKEAGPETKVGARGRLGRPLQADAAMAGTARTVGSRSASVSGSVFDDRDVLCLRPGMCSRCGPAAQGVKSMRHGSGVYLGPNFLTAAVRQCRDDHKASV